MIEIRLLVNTVLKYGHLYFGLCTNQTQHSYCITIPTNAAFKNARGIAGAVFDKRGNVTRQTAIEHGVSTLCSVTSSMIRAYEDAVQALVLRLMHSCKVRWFILLKYQHIRNQFCL